MRMQPSRYRRLAGLCAGLALLAGCATRPSPSTPTLPTGLATSTAIVASKYTQAAELTAYPITSLPTETGPAPTLAWTPGPGELSAADSGKSVTIGITSRISVILEESLYPKANMKQECTAPLVLGGISNIPVVPPGYYVVRYEGVGPGSCTISNGSFEVTIKVVGP